MQKRTLNDTERRDWLRLFRSENVGPATFLSLMEHFDKAADALDAAPGLSRRVSTTTGSMTTIAAAASGPSGLRPPTRSTGRLTPWCPLGGV